MSDAQQPPAPESIPDDGPMSGTTDPAAAELADAVASIRSTGEDWRSSERATDGDHDEKEHDNG